MTEPVDTKIVMHRLDSIDKTLVRITESLDRLVRVEERQMQMHQAIERAFESIAEADTRLSVIERKLPDVARTSVWVDRAVWGTAAAGVMYVLKKTGLL